VHELPDELLGIQAQVNLF